MDFNEDLKKTPSKKMTSSPRPFTRIFGTALAEAHRLTKRALNRRRTDTNTTQRDRWRRYGAFGVSLAERARHGASYNPLSERTIQVLVAVEMRGYLANSPRELTVPVEANQR